MKDQSFRMQDETGSVIELTIDGATVVCLMNDGYCYDDAIQAVMDEAYFSAIQKGLIKDNAWVIEYV